MPRNPGVPVRVRIRRGDEADARAISRVHFEAVRGTAAAFYPAEVIEGWSCQPDAERHEQVRRAIAGADEVFVVADCDGSLVGFGAVALSTHEVRAVYVHPDYGRCGVGGTIVRELERTAIAHGLPALHLDASVNAEAFYRRHGYDVIERSTHRLRGGPEMACVRMKKRLPAIESTSGGAKES